MYSKSNKEPNLNELRKLGLEVFSTGRVTVGKNDEYPIRLSYTYDRRTVRITLKPMCHTTVLTNERYSIAIDMKRERMYFIPDSVNGYKVTFNNRGNGNDNKSGIISISGKLFDQLRMLRGALTNIDKFPDRQLNHDEALGLFYIKLIIERAPDKLDPDVAHVC